MPKSYFLLVVLGLLAIPSLPVAARAQVNPPTDVNPATGELVEQHYADRYQVWLRDRRRRGQLAKSEKLEEMQEREAAYAADACGLGCSDHEGIQVRGIPGTSLAAVVYKAKLDDDVLILQLRFHNDGSDPARLTIDPPSAPEGFFVQVGEKKLFIIKGEDGELEAKKRLAVTLEAGEMESWWAQFPAPASGTKAFDLQIPAVTFRDVPLKGY
ncbi:MAG: hypothetical protein ACREK2_02060 [Gemmatimonadota bacterium]